MRILSLHVLRWEEEKSLFITSAYELSFVGYFVTLNIVGFNALFLRKQSILGPGLLLSKTSIIAAGQKLVRELLFIYLMPKLDATYTWQIIKLLMLLLQMINTLNE